eukprot:TRINITY_DN3180_c0_g1_i1.p1 TRINITY_DN3180_c0_g1~~TRINITY_DN3180_c0_g1_i1.p1  ORF type:complete len:668 (-),score=212.18 TRINITY_DN3180_c0_g1_i1:73-1998(-)
MKTGSKLAVLLGLVNIPGSVGLVARSESKEPEDYSFEHPKKLTGGEYRAWRVKMADMEANSALSGFMDTLQAFKKEEAPTPKPAVKSPAAEEKAKDPDTFSDALSKFLERRSAEKPKTANHAASSEMKSAKAAVPKPDAGKTSVKVEVLKSKIIERKEIHSNTKMDKGDKMDVVSMLHSGATGELSVKEGDEILAIAANLEWSGLSHSSAEARATAIVSGWHKQKSAAPTPDVAQKDVPKPDAAEALQEVAELKSIKNQAKTVLQKVSKDKDVELEVVSMLNEGATGELSKKEGKQIEGTAANLKASDISDRSAEAEAAATVRASRKKDAPPAQKTAAIAASVPAIELHQHGWTQLEDSDGKTYYYNTASGVKMLEKPDDFKSAQELAPGAAPMVEEPEDAAPAQKTAGIAASVSVAATAPGQKTAGIAAPVSVAAIGHHEHEHGWAELKDADGKTYYYHEASGVKTSEKPDDFKSAQELALGASQTAEKPEDAAPTQKTAGIAASVSVAATAPAQNTAGIAAPVSVAAIGHHEHEHGWAELKDADGKTYYYHEASKVQTSEKPDDFKSAQELALGAAQTAKKPEDEKTMALAQASAKVSYAEEDADSQQEEQALEAESEQLRKEIQEAKESLTQAEKELA